MNISVLTLFPDLYASFLETSLIKRAQEQDKAHITLQNLFSYVAPKQRIEEARRYLVGNYQSLSYDGGWGYRTQTLRGLS